MGQLWENPLVGWLYFALNKPVHRGFGTGWGGPWANPDCCRKPRPLHKLKKLKDMLDELERE